MSIMLVLLLTVIDIDPLFNNHIKDRLNTVFLYDSTAYTLISTTTTHTDATRSDVDGGNRGNPTKMF